MRLRIAVLLVFPVFIAAWMWLAATSECGPGAGCVATARVQDIRYSIGVARSMRIEEADLTAYAIASRRSPSNDVLDEQTYRLGSIDPTRVLVMKLVPGQADDAGPLGDYLLLVAFGDPSAWLLTCPYFDRTDATRPEGCP